MEPHPPSAQPDQPRSPVDDAAAAVPPTPGTHGGSGPAPGRGDELLEGLRAVRQDLAAAEDVHAARWQQLAAALDVTEPGLAALRVDLADALEAVRDRLVSTVEAGAGATTGALESTTAAVTEVVHGLRELLLDRLEEHQSQMRARMADVTAQVQAGGAATRATQERLAALTTATEQLQRTVLALQAEWDARVDSAAERLVQAAGEAAEAVGARLVEQLRTAGDQPRQSGGDPVHAGGDGAGPEEAPQAPAADEVLPGAEVDEAVPEAGAGGPAEDEGHRGGAAATAQPWHEEPPVEPEVAGGAPDRSFQPRRRPQWRRS